MIDGETEYRVDDEKCKLSSEDLVFIRAGSMRERIPNDKKIDYVSFNFLSDHEYNIPTVLKRGVTPEVRHIIAAFDEALGRAGNRLEILGCLLEALLIIISECAMHKYSPSVEKVLNYIKENRGEKITLAKIGETLHFSGVYCDSLFKKEVGKSIIDYLIDERIREAKSLIVETNLTVSEIAHSVGYDDANYFSRLFKKRTGYSPLRYKDSVLKRFTGEK
jgi:AraC-like DNA-binding protein